MDKIKIIKKNDEYSSEYQIGDTFEIEGTWYGGVHIIGKTGAPVSLDKDEYIYLDANPENKAASTSVISHPESSASTQTSTVIPEAQPASTLSANTEKNNAEPLHEIHVGDIVRHFKREWVSEESTKYLRNRRKAGCLPGNVCTIQNLCKTIRYVYERSRSPKISGDQAAMAF